MGVDVNVYEKVVNKTFSHINLLSNIIPTPPRSDSEEGAHSELKGTSAMTSSVKYYFHLPCVFFSGAFGEKYAGIGEKKALILNQLINCFNRAKK